MDRPPPRSWGPLLLVLGGVVFAAIGFRSLALEREASEQAREARRAMIHADLRADANRLLRGPAGKPLGHWRLEPPGVPPGAGASAMDMGPEVLHSPEQARISDLELAKRALAQKDTVHALELFASAATASPLLLDGATPPVRVRVAALAQLAREGLRRGDTEPLRRFLDDVEDGVRIEKPGEIGPAQLLIDLHEEVEANRAAHKPAPAPTPSGDWTRLADAARHARLGLTMRGYIPEDGVRLWDPHWVLRKGVDIWLYPVAALFEGDYGARVQSVRVVRHEALTGLALGPDELQLDPPFERVIFDVVPEPEGGGHLIPILALFLGLLVYAAGGVLVMRGWRRSRLVAEQQADFVASVSHELKTPIASVRAMAELLETSAGDADTRTKTYAARIDREMQRLGTTVKNVLDAAQIERGTLPITLVPGDPATWLREVGERLAPELRAREATFTCAIDDAPGTCAFDPDALEGVVRNLVDNAVKFSPGAAEVELLGHAGTGTYVIEVRDRGSGFGAQEQSRIFRRFYRGEAARGGSAPGVGLGLHIAGQVAERHGARLFARPRPGGGAIVGLELRDRV